MPLVACCVLTSTGGAEAERRNRERSGGGGGFWPATPESIGSRETRYSSRIGYIFSPTSANKSISALQILTPISIISEN